jgi:hypothetical protein
MNPLVPPNWFLQSFAGLLEQNDSEKKPEKLWNEIVWETMIVEAALVVIGIALATELIWLGIIASLFLPIGFWYFFLLLRAEYQKQQKEALVPDLLLSCSSFPKGTDSMAFFRFGSSAHFGLLGKEFEKASLEIRHGASVEQALHGMKKRCKSRVIERMADLLLLGYESGADLSKVFRETAEDLFETRFLLQERQAVLLVQKYTILLAGGLIVPIVLGLVSGLVQQLDFSSLASLEIGLDAGQRKELLEAAGLGTVLYLLEYSLLASFFVANQEGNWKKGILYSAVLLPIGFVGFWIAKGI